MQLFARQNGRSVLALAAVAALAISSQSCADSFKHYCKSAFAHKIHREMPHVKLHDVMYIPGKSTLELLWYHETCGEAYETEQFIATDTCRLNMTVPTSEKSNITMEAWFPRNYKGRFLSTGNGGLGGCIQYGDMALATNLGFATVGANNGHDGIRGTSFLGNDETLKDFVHRSVHMGVVIGKKLTNMFYPEGYDKSYYLGCSTGGRQGWKALHAHPTDFDGIVAGAPAFNFVNLIAFVGHFGPLTGKPGEDKYLPQEKWELVQAEVMRQCDGIDGVEDGVIENPDLCNPVFTELICPSGSSSSDNDCLTGPQAVTARKVFEPLYGEEGKLLYPRLNPGAIDTTSATLFSGDLMYLSTDWFQNVVYNSTDWDPDDLNTTDMALALKQDPFGIETWDANLAQFRDQGRKILHYHGTQDELISSDSSKLFYERVAEQMNASPQDLDEFYRFFPISGMGHCLGGSGPHYIGNQLDNYYKDDAENNVLMKLVRWVEDGIAPEYIRGANISSTPGKKTFTRKHCKWPMKTVYKGPDFTDENSWGCEE
ncbi:putative feruloyl esterase [Aspergillus heteromorphus CBS 117.55]|uniref:Carboxylic ester hydrolase n=1 Tax=Aspergillus heteromorphus CBS 117.55 TaxID=1448321 RepID=A0A317W3H6_9EURO|nr:putative feruloyl esterase [Aspergillus heteromorphus CBS 117.55]PWY80565.1 putative feruloyl esterase [Aspergillus heteromorphus CBS 117.55]